MTWQFLFEEALKNEENNTSAEGREVPTEGSASWAITAKERDDTYQKKLFENDLYVWSLLLIRNDKV
jgi:hypothetical protein